MTCYPIFEEADAMEHWTWLDGRVLALILALVGAIGAVINTLVLLGVAGNARLGIMAYSPNDLFT